MEKAVVLFIVISLCIFLNWSYNLIEKERTWISEKDDEEKE